ncbi:MAG: FAD-dependent oxidoreductase [Peptococcaceae bacterium]|nr:FAD-dependent oxidoreductase [Peptococcaceae bacterium]
MNFVIVGNSAAGIAAAETLRSLEPGAGITVVTEEVHPPYSRCRVAEVVAGAAGLEDIRYRAESFYRDREINLIRGARVTSVDPAGRRIILGEKGDISYDRLLVATGSRPVGAGVEGSGLEGVFVLRSYDQAEALARAASTASRAVVIGGGLVGLKAAQALRERGVREVTVVVKSSHLLTRQLDAESAAMVEKEMREAGIGFVYGFNPAGFNPKAGGESVGSVVLEDGREMPADLVLVAKGVRPNAGLVREAGGEAGAGIKVNEYMETSLPGIYAAGDCIEVKDLVTRRRTPSALWTLAVEQGRYAACNMAGRRKAYPPPLTRLNAARFGKIPFVSVGAVEQGEEFLTRREAGGIYRKLAFREDRLVGFILAGSIGQAGVYTALVKGRRPLGGLRWKLLRGSLSAADLMVNRMI